MAGDVLGCCCEVALLEVVLRNGTTQLLSLFAHTGKLLRVATLTGEVVDSLVVLTLHRLQLAERKQIDVLQLLADIGIDLSVLALKGQDILDLLFKELIFLAHLVETLILEQTLLLAQFLECGFELMNTAYGILRIEEDAQVDVVE